MTYECACDFDPPEWSSVRDTKSSRKERKCCECGAKITVGSPYRGTTTKYVGHVDTYIWCKLCADLCDWARISVPCFCWLFEALHDEVKTMVDDVRRDVPGFFFEYGRRAIAIRRAGGSI